MATYLTNDQYAINKGFKDGFVKFTITCVDKASLANSEYFFSK